MFPFGVFTLIAVSLPFWPAPAPHSKATRMGKRKFNPKSFEPTQAGKKRTRTSVFRMARPPTASTPLVTTLRKGSYGRRGHRREQLSDIPPGTSTKQQSPSDANTPDPLLPDFELPDDSDDFNTIMPSVAMKASNPKRVRKNTTSVSTLLLIYLNL